MVGETALSGKYKAYPEYKDSGIDMLGTLPVSWETKQVRYLLKDGAEGIKIGPFGSALKLEDMVDNGTRVYGQENVIKKDFSLGKRRISEAKFAEMQVYQVYTNDLIVTMMGTSGKCELVPEDAELGIIDSHLLRLRVKETKILPRFFRLLVDECYEVENQIKISGKGSIMHGLNSSIVKSLTLPLPSPTEQGKILDFLDHETAKIDTLIDKQQQLITLLKEKRQAVISHAVTKGLNPSAPMRDSGVEWLGEVPAHWEMVPLKYLCNFSGGGTPSKDNLSFWTGGDIPWVSPKDMKSFRITDTQDKLTERAVVESSTNFVEPGALLIVVRSGILQRTIPIAINSVRVTLNQDMKALKFKQQIDAEYAANYILGNVSSLLLEWSKEGATVESIEQEYLSGSLTPVPPKQEQDAINAEVKSRMAFFDDLEAKAVKGIGLLKERRTALISAAVTGKIDVRNWQCNG